MAHFLMIESFIGGNAVILPKRLMALGHTYTFLTRSLSLYQSPYKASPHEVIANAAEIINVDTNDVEAILNAVTGKSFDGVLTTCDYYIDQVVAVSKALNLTCPFSQNVDLMRYKHKMREAIDKAHLPNPKYRVAHSWNEALEAVKDIGLPLVLKPVDLASSAFVRLIPSLSALEEAYKSLRDFTVNWRGQKREGIVLLEAYMTGEEFSVETITFNGKTEIVGITEKMVMGSPCFIESGHMFPAHIEPLKSEAISTYVKAVLEGLEVTHGICHNEVKFTDEGPRIVEINPRPAGGYIVDLVALTYGVDLLSAFIELSKGEKPNLAFSISAVKSACIHYITAPSSGVVKQIKGMDLLKKDPNVLTWVLEDCVGKRVEAPVDNASRLGWVITKDERAFNAMAFAKKAIDYLEFNFEGVGDTVD